MRRSRLDSSKRSSVELKGWRNVRMPRRVHFHRHINFRPGTLAISCMFIQFLLDPTALLSLSPRRLPTTGQLTDVIMDSSPPTHYGSRFFFLSLYLPLVSRRAFSFAATKHDRCVALTRSLKYSGEFAASQFSAISQKPPFILSLHRDTGAVNVRETSVRPQTHDFADLRFMSFSLCLTLLIY